MSDETRNRVSRRGFLLGASAGVVAGGVGGAMASRFYSQLTTAPPEPVRREPSEASIYTRKQFTGKTREIAKPQFAIPGPYPGRVVEVKHQESVRDGAIQADPVKEMLARGMMELTGAPDAVQAWQRLFKKGERVGIKVNPVGYARKAGLVGVISSFAVIMAIVEGLKSAGIAQKDIILFERYADEFRAAGYERFVESELPEVKWYAAALTGGNRQIDLEGRDPNDAGKRRDPDPHVVGYDRDVFRHLDYTMPEYDQNDPFSYESHVSRILTDEKTVDVQKIITIPLLKDHRSAGITIALKNMSHGMVSNVARTHVGRGRLENRCGTFTPKIVELPVIRQKCVLHVMDALIATYEGGPGTWNNSWGTWEYRGLFLATDPVAMDHVGWDLLDAERNRRGWAPVAQMGVAGNNRSGTEAFYLRQPEHVELAGFLDLGRFDPTEIEHRIISL